jgi:hypothetical protein
MGPPPTERERQRSHVPETGTANPFTYLEKKQIMNGTSKGTLWRGRARRVDRTTTRFVLLVAVAVHLSDSGAADGHTTAEPEEFRNSDTVLVTRDSVAASSRINCFLEFGNGQRNEHYPGIGDNSTN